MAITRPKGTFDILPQDVRKWVRLEEIIRKVCKLYNFEEIRTPIFEQSALFHRNANDTSDMVTKETYDFIDRGQRGMTLRPEGTAGTVRAFIENKLYADGSLQKFFYMGPSFRYERPQKGRSRQFHQFGIEALGSNSPLLDAEVITCATTLIKALGLKGIKVKINSIGDEESRTNYRKVLVKYFEQYKSELCNDCLVRLEKNPLRILDCKVDKDKEFFKNAPKISDYLTEASKQHFKCVLEALDTMGVAYEIDENLVRGLDYYTHTVFEIEVDVKDFGAQNVICAGGRYDNLVSDLEGPKTPAVGLAFGMERLLLALESEGRNLVKPFCTHLYIISLGEKANLEALKLANICRIGGLSCEIDHQGRGLKSQFKQADKFCAKYTAILGDNEIEQGTINVKDNETDIQETIGINELYPYLVNAINKKTASPCASCKEKKE